MEPQIGQVWKFANDRPVNPIIEYHLIVGYIPKVTRWILYNIETGEPDMDYTDQFQDKNLWTFIQ
jgi:hypothetical protein